MTSDRPQLWPQSDSSVTSGRPRLHLPLRFLSVALSDPSVTRWVSCVTVSDVCRVSVTAECALCGHRLSAGCCGFVGCHGSGKHVFTARARSVRVTACVDQGGCLATRWSEPHQIGYSVMLHYRQSDGGVRACPPEVWVESGLVSDSTGCPRLYQR